MRPSAPSLRPQLAHCNTLSPFCQLQRTAVTVILTCSFSFNNYFTCAYPSSSFTVNHEYCQELVRCAPPYVAACDGKLSDKHVDDLLDACLLPSVVDCCGAEGQGAAVLISAIQVVFVY
jgi:hypothetical protein